MLDEDDLQKLYVRHPPIHPIPMNCLCCIRCLCHELCHLRVRVCLSVFVERLMDSSLPSAVNRVSGPGKDVQFVQPLFILSPYLFHRTLMMLWWKVPPLHTFLHPSSLTLLRTLLPLLWVRCLSISLWRSTVVCPWRLSTMVFP